MFSRRKNYAPNTPNTVVNKLVTYGLIAFLVIIMFNSKTEQPKRMVDPRPVNFTPVELGNYVRIKNLATGEYNYVSLEKSGDTKFRLVMSAEDYKKLAPKGEFAPLYEVEIYTSKTANIFSQD